MISGLKRRVDTFFGRGEAAVTVPPLDGALRANSALDEAPLRLPLEGVDALAEVAGVVHASAGSVLYALEGDVWAERQRFDAPIAALSAYRDGLAVALNDGSIHLPDGSRLETGLHAITAMAVEGETLILANGSEHNTDWQRDLLQRGATGSVWRCDGGMTRIAAGLAWPSGLAVDAGGIVVAEGWRHRLVRLAGGQVLLSDLPAYPGRLSKAPGGWWLSAFAPRSQLVEFVLREPGYRQRMMAEVPMEYWVAPKLRSGHSFYESLQGGGVKQLGKLKPWAPTMSAGFCIRLDEQFQPTGSLQSRADGQTHGVTDALETQGRLHVAAKGDGLVAVLPQGEGA
ncbi:hypothetical protein [Pararhodobacter sp. CCB-MM2]|uniref:hypothetical protein n=1 Tax=Pararhodobacter sp. CCB-MM2 TaxID=1786003 RepID=UPI00082DBDC8|nr:hypothetical protein [Pararhodobacter sp. CCB-MM2]